MRPEERVGTRQTESPMSFTYERTQSMMIESAETEHGFAAYGKGSLTLTGSELAFTPVKHCFVFLSK